MKIRPRFRSLVTLAATASTLLLFAASLAAQESTTRGLHLGFHVQGASLTVEDSDHSGGGGVGFRVGYGINRIVTFYFEVDGVAVEVGDDDTLSGEWALGHGEVGARFHFANSLRSWVPFLDVSVGSRVVKLSEAVLGNDDLGDIDFSGGAFSLGGGIYAYFTQTLGMEAGVKFTSGKFTDIDLGGFSLTNLDIDASSTRFKVGLVWWP